MFETVAIPPRWRTARRIGRATAWLSTACIPLWAGCLSLTPLPDEAPVVEQTDRTTGRGYFLYVPSTYSGQRPWPLVVACHGTRPYDTAMYETREWAKFAEKEGILVVAPALLGTKGDFPPSPDRQIALQRQDEEAILSIVRSIKGRYRIAEERVFMAGWSAAAYAILHTGLGHPDIFRALVIRQGTFDERFLDFAEGDLDRWQPILVIYGRMDFLRDQTLACIEWLRKHGQYVETLEIAGSHRRIDPKRPWEFFQRVVRERPWIRIRAHVPNPSEPRTVTFRVDAIPEADQLMWFFGDGTQSRDASPTHTYAEPGNYTVTVNVGLVVGKKYRRQRVVHVGPARD